MNEQYIDKFVDYQQMLPHGKLFRITYDNTIDQLKLVCSNKDIFQEIVDAFSSDNPGAFFSQQYGYKGQQKFYEISKFGYFQAGILFDILQWIKLHYGDLQTVAISEKCKQYIDDFLTPLKKYLKNSQLQISNISDDVGRNNELKKAGKQEFQFRDYQKNAIIALMQQGYGRGLIECPTGSGKSFIIGNLIWNVMKNVDRSWKFLILVPNTQLVDQFYGDLLDYGYSSFQIAKFRGGMKKDEAKKNDIHTASIIIANRQFIFKHMKELPHIDALIADEAHTCIAASTLEFIERLDAKIKVGCSGTLPRDKHNKYQLMGLFGRIVFKEQITKLQNTGYISKLKITLIDIFDKQVEANKKLLFNLHTTSKYIPDEFGNSDIMFNDAYNAELAYYEKNYIDLYTPVIKYIDSLQENTIVLFDRIEIGKSLFELSKQISMEKTSYYIDGSTRIEDRENIRKCLEESGNNILYGNVSIIGTGMNIKRLNHIVFAINTKSHSRVIQAIGRTLRLHAQKDIAHLIDIKMNFKYSTKHYNERLKFYKDFYNKSKPDEIINVEI